LVPARVDYILAEIRLEERRANRLRRIEAMKKKKKNKLERKLKRITRQLTVTLSVG
jgi:hypothetical protein